MALKDRLREAMADADVSQTELAQACYLHFPLSISSAAPQVLDWATLLFCRHRTSRTNPKAQSVALTPLR